LLRSLVKKVDWIAERTGKTASALAVIIMLTMTFEVIARYAFNSPTRWSYDLTYMLGGVLFLFTAPYVLLEGGNVRVDIFYSRYSPKVKRIVDLALTPLLFAPALGVLVYQAWDFALRALAMNEKAVGSVWEPSIVPFRFAIAVGYSLLLLEGIAWFVRDLFFVIKAEGMDGTNR